MISAIYQFLVPVLCLGSYTVGFFCLLSRRSHQASKTSTSIRALFWAMATLYILIFLAGLNSYFTLNGGLAIVTAGAAFAAIGLYLQPLPKFRCPLNFDVGFLIVVLAIFIGYGLLFPATCFDDYLYHLPFLEMSYQYHGFDFYPWHWGHMYSQSYPKFGEMLMALPTMLFHNVQTAFWPNPVWLVVCWLTVFDLARQLRTSDRLSMFAASVAIACPISLVLLSSAKVDLAYVCFVYLIVYFAFLAFKDRLGDRAEFRRNIFYAIASMAILATIKASGLATLGLMTFTLLGVAIWRARQLRESFHRFTWSILGFAFAMTMVFPIYWYARNWLWFKNPFYPIVVRNKWGTLFDGTIDIAEFFPLGEFLERSLPSKLFYNWFEQQDWVNSLYMIDNRYAGIGPIWLIFGVTSTLFFLMRAIYFKQQERVFLIFAFALIFYITPFNWLPRYTFFLSGLGAVTMAAIFFEMKGKTQTALVWATRILMVYSLVSVLDNAVFIFHDSSVKAGRENLSYQQIYSNPAAMAPQDIRRQFRSLISNEDPPIISMRANGIKEFINRECKSCRIGVSALTNYSAIRRSDLQNSLFYIPIPNIFYYEAGRPEADAQILKSIRDLGLDYLTVIDKEPLGKIANQYSQMFTKILCFQHSCETAIYKVNK